MVFSVNENDIGNIECSKMKKSYRNYIPIQQNYNAIPKHLYKEIKHYMEDLPNKQCIINSQSKDASTFVYVCQRDGTIRLCCDYRQLNPKNIPDCHALTCIQDLIDQLGRN